MLIKMKYKASNVRIVVEDPAKLNRRDKNMRDRTYKRYRKYLSSEIMNHAHNHPLGWVIPISLVGS